MHDVRESRDDRVPARIRFTRDRVHALLLVLAGIGLLVNMAVLWHWYVEDSAISFAYARHLIQGEGLVAFPGGERVEGYSNPTWVLVLAALQLVGLDPFVSTKFVQAALCLATLPVVYLTIREITGRESDVPIVAVVFLSINAQFAIWGGAGLENGLLNFLIAVGFWRMMVEIRPGRTRFPWSAAIWLLVALTRPEGILYAAVAGFCSLVFQVHAGRSLAGTLTWLAVFFVPFGLYHAVHYWYFAWPFPNTYYAKLEDREGVRWIWDKAAGGKNPQAWNWTRNFFHEMGQGYFLPIWILGATGDGRARWVLATAVFLLVGGMIELSSDQRWLLPVVVGTLWAGFWLGLRKEAPASNPWWLMPVVTAVALGLVAASEILRSFHLQPNLLPVPTFVKIVPPYVLAGLAILLATATFRSRGWQLRFLAWSFCCAVIVFAIYVQWDWMKGFRWYSTASVPGAILFAFGVDGMVRLVEEMFGWTPDATVPWRRWSVAGTVLAAVLVLLQLPANILETRKLLDAPDAAPKGIKVRVDYMDAVRDRLHIEERLVDLDVDQGAHLWWSDFEMMDVAGLVDLPRAHHGFDKRFVREYVFEQRKPHVAHVHGGWASNSKIPTHPEWRRDYFEIPGYPSGKTSTHPGNFVRRDLFLRPEWPHGGEPVRLEKNVVLYGVHVDSEPGQGHQVYVEVGFSGPQPQQATIVAPGPDGKRPPALPKLLPKDRNIRVFLFASDGEHLQVWDIPPGYDWLKPEKWTKEEIFVGKFDLTLPESMPPGTWDLGFLFLAPDGTVIGRQLDPTAEPVVAPPPRFAAGEILYPGALVVLSAEERAAAAVADRKDALASAERLDCEAAERSWQLARRHRAGDERWAEEFLPEMKTAFATCWARSSDGQEREERVRRLVRARTWDWWNDEYRARAPALADELYADGMDARARQDWEAAYRLFSDAVDVDRTRSWARRYAEEARAFRLGIDPESLEREKALEAEKKKTAPAVAPAAAPAVEAPEGE